MEFRFNKAINLPSTFSLDDILIQYSADQLQNYIASQHGIPLP
jgi:hypothetical protein